MTDSTPEPDDDVHRLIDMIVEEVSLVDRAANQRRFLLVKRSQAMSDEPNDDEGDAAGDAADDEPALETEAADAPDASADPGTTPAPATGGAGTEAVVAALEALTGVVEMLATQSTEKAKKKPPAPADEGDEEDLADGGVDEAEEGDAPDAPTEDTPPPPKRPPPPKKKTKADDVDPLADVRAQLARIESALGHKPAKKRDPSAPNPIGVRLAEVVKMLGDLKTQIAGQANRLAKVEKNVGAPASKPVDGPPRKASDADVSWPLDVNAPRDRESVDKDVSFH